jgi:hypothetical protein
MKAQVKLELHFWLTPWLTGSFSFSIAFCGFCWPVEQNVFYMFCTYAVNT